MPDKRSSSTDGDEERRNRNVFVGVLGTAQRAAKRKRHSSTSEPTTTAFLYKSSSSHPPMPAATEEDEAALMAAMGLPTALRRGDPEGNDDSYEVWGVEPSAVLPQLQDHEAPDEAAAQDATGDGDDSESGPSSKRRRG